MKLLILVLLGTLLTIRPAELSPVTNTTSTEEFVPAEPTSYTIFIETIRGSAGDVARRKLAPWTQCMTCKCCANGNCVDKPCCYGLDCNLPNKPPGTCAFVPKSCDCTACPN
ncbi:hypothetical protein Tsubulata_000059 [Turnera subulata]|uniref:DUF7866 domain-containing protein n=1 Tax=Turnera subulata TaxID=218843 RepID=A0A9Q0FJ94_9ROSI|nr:hypothetical protein Tsubulata_000059 [Turnera subulata]